MTNPLVLNKIRAAGVIPIRRRHFKKLPIEDVVELAQNGDKDAMIFLLTELKPFVRGRVKNYFFNGSDEDDVIQEGMIGLLSAIQDYKRGKSSFKSFASLCITRRVISAIKSANRQKNIPLNLYLSINSDLSWQNDGMNRTLEERIGNRNTIDPEKLIIEREEALNMIKKVVENLTPLERKVLANYISSDSYTEIAKEVGCAVKSVDNALQRIKKKAEKVINNLFRKSPNKVENRQEY